MSCGIGQPQCHQSATPSNSFYPYLPLVLDLEIKASGKVEVSLLVGLPQLYPYAHIA